MTFKVIYLYPRSSYRTPLRSDTLWGLLMVALRVVAGDQAADAFIEACEAGRPPVRISSAFPFLVAPTDTGTTVRHHFFPRPALPPPPLSRPDTMDPDRLFEQMRLGKQTRSIQWLPQSLFEAVLQGKLDEAGLQRALQEYRGPWPQLYLQDNLHTSIDRLTGTTRMENGAGQLFYSREFYLGRRQGLFFLCTGEVERLLPAIRYLHHTGWGGDSSVGKGHFDWERGTLTLNVPDQPTHRVLLSLYSPTAEELAHLRHHPEKTWYRLERRQGYAGAHRLTGGAYRKPPLYMLAEGAVVPDPGRPLCGSVHRVLRSGPVWIRHSGLALDVPARIQGT